VTVGEEQVVELEFAESLVHRPKPAFHSLGVTPEENVRDEGKGTIGHANDPVSQCEGRDFARNAKGGFIRAQDAHLVALDPARQDLPGTKAAGLDVSYLAALTEVGESFLIGPHLAAKRFDETCGMA
jgi:hypothetical protein